MKRLLLLIFFFIFSSTFATQNNLTKWISATGVMFTGACTTYTFKDKEATVYGMPLRKENLNNELCVTSLHGPKKHDRLVWGREGLNIQTGTVYDEEGYDVNGWSRYMHRLSDRKFYIFILAYFQRGLNINHSFPSDLNDLIFQFAKGPACSLLILNKYTGTLYDIKGWSKEGVHKETGTAYYADGWSRDGTEHKDTGTRFGPDGWNFYGTEFMSDDEEGATILDIGYYADGWDFYGEQFVTDTNQRLGRPST